MSANSEKEDADVSHKNEEHEQEEKEPSSPPPKHNENIEVVVEVIEEMPANPADTIGWYLSIPNTPKPVVVRRRFESVIDPLTGYLRVENDLCGFHSITQMHLVCVSDPTCVYESVENNRPQSVAESETSPLGSQIHIQTRNGVVVEGRVRAENNQTIVLEMKGMMEIIQKSDILVIRRPVENGFTIFSFSPQLPSVVEGKKLVFDCFYLMKEGSMYWETTHTASWDRVPNSSLTLTLAVEITNTTNFNYENATISLSSISENEPPKRKQTKNKISSFSMGSNDDVTYSTSNTTSAHFRLPHALTLTPYSNTKVTLANYTIPSSSVHTKLFVSLPHYPPTNTQLQLNNSLFISNFNGTPRHVLDIEVATPITLPSLVMGNLDFYETLHSNAGIHTRCHTTNIMSGCENRFRIPLVYDEFTSNPYEIEYKRVNYQPEHDFAKEEFKITIENKEDHVCNPLIIQSAAFRHSLWEMERSSHPALRSPSDSSLFEFEISVSLFQSAILNYSIRYPFSSQLMQPQAQPLSGDVPKMREHETTKTHTKGGFLGLFK
jgi:hypothetical protein